VKTHIRPTQHLLVAHHLNHARELARSDEGRATAESMTIAPSQREGRSGRLKGCERLSGRVEP